MAIKDTNYGAFEIGGKFIPVTRTFDIPGKVYSIRMGKVDATFKIGDYKESLAAFFPTEIAQKLHRNFSRDSLINYKVFNGEGSVDVSAGIARDPSFNGFILKKSKGGIWLFPSSAGREKIKDKKEVPLKGGLVAKVRNTSMTLEDGDLMHFSVLGHPISMNYIRNNSTGLNLY